MIALHTAGAVPTLAAFSAATMDLRTVVSASPEHVACELADELVILSLETGEYYGLSPVSASVWTLLAEPRTVAEVRDGLLAQYEGITPEECEEQLLQLLAEMRELKLIVVRETV